MLMLAAPTAVRPWPHQTAGSEQPPEVVDLHSARQVCRVQTNLSGTKTGGTVPRVGEQISRADLASAAGQLRTVLASVSADPDHAAYLRGAADALAMLTGLADGSRGVPKRR